MAAGTEDQESALRPLRNVASTTAALRSGELTEEESRAAVIQVAAAVEMSLRRLLRDYPGAALQVRLRALAPDELRADEVLAELRQHDQISIELAAAVHDLLEVRQRLRGGAPLSPQDATLAYQVADRLEQEANRPHPPVPAPSPTVDEFEEEASVLAASPPRRRRRMASTPPKGQLALAGVVIVLLVALGVWWAAPGDSSELEEGITLFRMGAYEDAASHFWRFAQENPEDPTPRLYLARIHRRLERPDLAAAQLDTALELAPEDPDVFVELGFLLIDTGHPAEAVGRFRSALSLDPDSETAWIGLVTALREDGRPDAAERVVQTAPPALRPRLALPVDSAAAP
ncbi:MAG TPA: tetratricopeptide repeat protein [Longimicrobiaceae bacterium]